MLNNTILNNKEDHTPYLHFLHYPLYPPGSTLISPILSLTGITYRLNLNTTKVYLPSNYGDATVLSLTPSTITLQLLHCQARRQPLHSELQVHCRFSSALPRYSSQFWLKPTRKKIKTTKHSSEGGRSHRLPPFPVHVRSPASHDLPLSLDVQIPRPQRLN